MTYKEALYWHTHNGAMIEQERESEILIRESLEKQIPKKPIESNKYDYNCPCCNVKLPIEPEDIYIYQMPTPNHCEDCGQALDWSDSK